MNYNGDNSLRIKFKVSKNPWASEPNSAHIEIYNMNPARRAILDALIPRSIEATKTPVTIEAGYEKSVNPGIGTIFKGKLLTVAHSRKGTDVITKIIAASYDAALVPVKGNYPSPANIGTVVADLLKQIGKVATDIDIAGAVSRAVQGDLAGAEQALTKSLSIDGMGMPSLQKLLEPFGFTVSQQDNKIQLRKEGEAVPGRSIILNDDSGLTGQIDPINDVRRPGVFLIQAASLLRHDIDVGATIELTGISQKGNFVVEQVAHHGDTHGGSASFITRFTGRSLSHGNGGIA